MNHVIFQLQTRILVVKLKFLLFPILNHVMLTSLFIIRRVSKPTVSRVRTTDGYRLLTKEIFNTITIGVRINFIQIN